MIKRRLCNSHMPLNIHVWYIRALRFTCYPSLEIPLKYVNYVIIFRATNERDFPILACHESYRTRGSQINALSAFENDEK